jgi:hypothetical protein
MKRIALALLLVAAASFAGEGHKQCAKKDSTAVSDTSMCCKKKKGECPKMKDSTGVDKAECAKKKAECKKHDKKGE